MASRRKARILAFQALYFWESALLSDDKSSKSNAADLGDKSPKSAKENGAVGVEELLGFAWLEEEKLSSLDEGMAAFSRILIAGTIENIKEIDKLIKEHLVNWDISRLNRVDLAVLRMSVYSLLYQKEISASIIIDEAIGICREYSADDSFKFVNGVLDSIRRSI